MQHFKVGDELELKMEAAAAAVLDDLSLQKDEFHENAFTSYPLGDIIYDDNRSPLSRAIVRDIFRTSFNEIFQAFTTAGSFESYLAVFRKIFGNAVGVTFTVPAPGKLQIDITAAVIELNQFVSRRIVNNAYVLEDVVTQAGDALVFQTIKGFQSQYELEQMLFEMVPDGIYTEINLDLGA